MPLVPSSALQGKRFQLFILRNGIFAAISVNKGCHSHQQLQPSQMISRWAQRQLRKERISAIEEPPHCSHSLWWALRKLRMWRKHKILTPDRWCAYQRNDFRDPRLLHLPIHRKMLNSLTWYIWFSLTIIFWCSDYLPFLIKLPYDWVSPLASWEQFSLGHWRCCPMGLKS